MTKTYPHAVIYNGVFYPPDTEIEIIEEEAETPEEETIEAETPEEEKATKPKTKKAVKNDNA